METTTAPAPIRCVASQGFKHLDAGCGRPVLIGPGQELDLSPADFERLRGLGAVARIEEVRQALVDDDALRREHLRGYFGREPTQLEIDEWARIPTEQLAETLEARRTSQQEWEEAKEKRLRDRLAREEAEAEAEALRHQKAAERARKRGKGG